VLGLAHSFAHLEWELEGNVEVRREWVHGTEVSLRLLRASLLES
jgi:hypothetical protein